MSPFPGLGADVTRWEQGCDPDNPWRQTVWGWGDINGDFKIDGADLAIIMANLGKGGPVTWDGTGEAPPEISRSGGAV